MPLESDAVLNGNSPPTKNGVKNGQSGHSNGNSNAVKIRKSNHSSSSVSSCSPPRTSSPTFSISES